MKYRASRSPLSYLGGLLALYLAVPVVAFLIRLAQPGDRGFGDPGLWPALWTSVATATTSTAIVALLGIPLAYWLARTRGPLNWLAGLIVQLPLALPPVMSGLVLIYVVGPYTWLGNLFNDELTGTVVGVVFAQTFVAGPFLVIAARAAFAAVDPALDELAGSLGRRPAGRFWLVTMRVAAPGIRAGLLMTWMRAIGEYGATVLLAYHPYTLPVFVYVLFSSTGIPATQAPTALALGVAVLVVLLSQIRIGRRRHRATLPPAPAPPPPADPVAVSFDLDVAVGTFALRAAHRAQSNRIAIIGPSGAGKSMTLRAIAGFLGQEAGTVLFNGEDVTRVRVEERRVGYVPQGHVMFPGLTAWQQVLFAAGADPALAAWWLGTLRLGGLADRLPEQLSGGQRQRVALARALAFRPRLVLLDEPFSALDAPVREELRRELRRLQREDGLSTVLVTHDPEEAALLADEILVIDEGRLLQAGPRAEVFARPASPQVARLLGIPNLIRATVHAPGVLAVGPPDGSRPAPAGAAPGGGGLLVAAETGDLAAGTEVLWTIRPDRVTVLPAAADSPQTYPAEVDDVADIGTLTTVAVRLRAGQDPAPELRVRTTAAVPFAPGDPCRVRLPAADITAWPAGPLAAAAAAAAASSSSLLDIMSRYAFLVLPSHNRVYADAAPALARAELAVLAAALPDAVIDPGSVAETAIGGVPYVTFEAGELSPRDADVLANLSALYALFEVAGDLLRPVPLRRLDRYDDDLLTILKYPGKTNEQFTKLLLNVTLASSVFAAEAGSRRLTVLDPLCGRGTTLNQALMYGFDALGADLDARDVEAYAVFIQRWLKDKRLKHQADFSPVRRDRRVVARRLTAQFAATRDEYKAGDLQRLDVVETDTARIVEFFRKESADLVVADLPYGVQHGSRGPGSQGAGTLARGPLDLLRSAAPAWVKALRPGGALGISWNTHVARREDAADALAAAGLQVLDGERYRAFRHRVDQAITRDILVARKPAAGPG